MIDFKNVWVSWRLSFIVVSNKFSGYKKWPHQENGGDDDDDDNDDNNNNTDNDDDNNNNCEINYLAI